jgi:hypothetical protein
MFILLSLSEFYQMHSMTFHLDKQGWVEVSGFSNRDPPFDPWLNRPIQAKSVKQAFSNTTPQDKYV